MYRRWKNSSLETAYTYNSWIHMLHRCYNPEADNFKFYGGRGIEVCDRWRENYDAFVEDMGLRPDGLTLERIDGNKPYSPENCRWATRQEQSRNRKSARILTFRGISKPHYVWAESLGVSWENLRNHIKRHTLDGAISRLIQRMRF